MASSEPDGLRSARLLAWLGAAVAVLVVGVLVFRLSGNLVPRTPPVVKAAGPKGEEVARMEPITVVFTGDVDQSNIERDLMVSPALDGELVWKTKGDEKLLHLQPRWPGYARGTAYAVRVNAGDPGRGGLGEPLGFSFVTEGK